MRCSAKRAQTTNCFTSEVVLVTSVGYLNNSPRNPLKSSTATEEILLFNQWQQCFVKRAGTDGREEKMCWRHVLMCNTQHPEHVSGLFPLHVSEFLLYPIEDVSSSLLPR